MSLERKMLRQKKITNDINEYRGKAESIATKVNKLMDDKTEFLYKVLDARKQQLMNSTKYFIWFEMPPIVKNQKSGSFIALSYSEVMLTKNGNMPVPVMDIDSPEYGLAYVKEDVGDEAFYIKQIEKNTPLSISPDGYGFYVVSKIM